jgi:signal transduction histidine kinase
MNRTCLAILTFLCLAELPATAAEDATDRTLSPYFFVEQGDRETDRLPLEETRADVRITGVIADTGKKSTGLGLNLVREVAQLQDGSVRVANCPGRGATAEIRLPRAVPA